MKSLYSEAKEHLSNCMPTSSSNSKAHNKYELEHEHQCDYNNYDNTNGGAIEGTISDDAAEYEHDRVAMTGEENSALNCHRRHSQTSSPTLGLNNNFITNTTTYDTLQKPFKYDKLRGRWSTAVDFYFACTSHAFGTIVFSELTLFVSLFLGGEFHINCLNI